MDQLVYENKGFITLMASLLVAAIELSISVSLLLLGLGASKTSFAIEQSYQANALSLACAETALQEIYDSMIEAPLPDPPPDPLPPPPTPFTGTGSLTLGQGSCSYSVTDTGGNARKITSTGTVGSVVKKNQITTSAVSPIVISSWQEVADFN